MEKDSKKRLARHCPNLEPATERRAKRRVRARPANVQTNLRSTHAPLYHATNHSGNIRFCIQHLSLFARAATEVSDARG